MTDETELEVEETTDVTEPEEVEETQEQEVSSEAGTEQQDTFDRAYVEKLRAEAAEHRTSRKAAEESLERLQDAYRGLAVAQAVSGLLVDPADLAWSDDFLTDDGLVDAQKVKDAATALIESKPHLGRVRGDVGQGFKALSEEVNLANLIRG